jgi:transposase
MPATEVKREVEERLHGSKQELVDWRRKAHYREAMHSRSSARERALEERIQELEAKVREYEEQHRSDQGVIAALKAKLKQLAGMLFGRKSEKSKPEEKPSGGEDEKDKGDGSGKRRRGKQRGARGFGRRRREELKTEIVYHTLSEDQKHCPGCGTAFTILASTEDSEEIDVRIEVVRILHKREMAKPACSCGLVPGIVTAAVPPKLIPKGMFTVGFWAYIIVEKVLLQRPLSRVILQLALWGLVDPRNGKPGLSQGTLTAGLKRIGELVEPLYQRILAETHGASHWHMDETRWLVFVETEGKEGHRWWLWVGRDEADRLLRARSVALLEGAEGPPGRGAGDRERGSLQRLQDLRRWGGRDPAGVLLDPCAAGFRQGTEDVSTARAEELGEGLARADRPALPPQRGATGGSRRP